MISWMNLRHRKWRDDLSAYVDGELNAARLAGLEAHLASCESCRQELAELQATKSLLRQLPEVQAQRSFAVPSGHVVKRTPAPAPWLGALRGATVATVAALALLLAVDFVSVDMSDDESASFQAAPAAQQTTAESAAGAAEATQTPIAADQRAREAPASDGTEPDALRDEGEARRVSEDSSDGWNGLRVAEAALGASVLVLAIGWIITARRRGRQV
jgi:anti-sigma factor RsiW